MEQPKTTITSLNFSRRMSLMSSYTVYIAEITYDQSDVDYALKATGEGRTHPDALQDALRSMTWTVALDNTFTTEEVQLLKAAYQTYLEHGETTWYTETTLANLAGVDLQPRLESNPVRLLASENLMMRHDEVARTLFRISDFGKYVVESHAQFNPTD